jgi:hypothetical protein
MGFAVESVVELWRRGRKALSAMRRRSSDEKYFLLRR